MKILPLLKKINSFISSSKTLNEENTKLFCVLPLFSYLGYDCFSSDEVSYEYCACLRQDKNERCDFVILGNEGKPYIVVEIKSFKKDLSLYTGQLKSYFVAETSAQYAILTNGDDYWFYESYQKVSIKEQDPVRKIRLSTINLSDIAYLNKFTRNVLLPINPELLKDVGHTETKLLKEERNEITYDDSAEVFMKTLILDNILGKCTDDVFSEYIDFCRYNGNSTVSKQLFTRKLKEAFSLKVQSRYIKGIKNDILVNDTYLITQNEMKNSSTSLVQTTDNNSVGLFYKDNTSLQIRNCSTEEIYLLYKDYCKENNLDIIPKIDFSKKIKNYFNVKIKPKSLNGKVQRCFI